ncbi:hypothetical protein HD554DRAFT_2027439 [Boletus coccyginus]|nr:hypothetical protein HD554DRAFT_2027439 [Boletus coccyginus]
MHDFNHNVTGHLLCPMDYNWKDEIHHVAILDSHSDFLVTSDSWLAFLYEGEKYDLKDPRKGLFKNLLLLKVAFKHIFMLLSSAFKTDIQCEHIAQTKGQYKLDECHTHSHIAALLGMKSISPYTIAYIIVQLWFVLLSCGSWWILDGNFNYHDFYNNIISFEHVKTFEDQKFIQDLLF